MRKLVIKFNKYGLFNMLILMIITLEMIDPQLLKLLRLNFINISLQLS
jgi:hypothetical protein